MGIIGTAVMLIVMVVVAVLGVLAFRFAGRTDDPFERTFAKVAAWSFGALALLMVAHTINTFFLKIETPFSPEAHRAPAQSRPPPDAVAPKIETTKADPFGDAAKQRQRAADAFEGKTEAP